MNRYTSFLCIIMLAALCEACANPAENKAKATVSETVPTTKMENKASGENLPITAENSKLSFVGSKVTGSEGGRFENFSGAIDLVEEKAEKSSVKVEIKMDSVVSDSKGLDEHLKTPDFFDVAKFPTASFTSTEIQPVKDKADVTHELKGTFELHGVSKTISFPANIKVNPDSVSVNSEFVINRKDFGIMYAGRTNDLIRDEVVIKMSIQAPRSKSK